MENETLTLIPDLFNGFTDSEVETRTTETVTMYEAQTAIYRRERANAKRPEVTTYNAGRVAMAETILQMLNHPKHLRNTEWLRRWPSISLHSSAKRKRQFALANDQERANYESGQLSALYHWARAAGVKSDHWRFCIESAESAV